MDKPMAAHQQVLINPWTRQFSRHRSLTSLTLSVLAAAATALPLQAAEKIFFVFTPLNLSLRVNSLEVFAEDGTINKNLGFYLNVTGASEEQIAQFREALTKRAEIDPVLLSRVLNTEIGEDLLNRIGKTLNIQGGSNGKYAIRAALLQAASEPEGLTLLNFFRRLPVNVQIDLERTLRVARTIEVVVEGTEYATQAIRDLSAQEAAANPPADFANLPDLRQPGAFGIQHQRWTLTDASRGRSFYVEVYQPQQWRSGKTPVVIISHGLSSRPEDFANRAKHLASHGYFVVLPQHIGSDIGRTKAFLEGFYRQPFDNSEFIDRPRDISYLIDELERRNSTEFDGRLDLNNVGVYGHSFGGYGAMAVAGATPDFDYLQEQCVLDYPRPNTALLLQCRALELEQKQYNFRDERVKAVIGANPVNRAIFGPEGLGKIKIPTLIAGGNYDPATPFVFEQVRSFPWLQTPDKYLIMMEGQAHLDFSQLDAGMTEMIKSIGELTLPSPDLLEDYSNAMTLAFFEVHIANNPKYRIYLQPSYFKHLSEGQDFKAFLITGNSSDKLTEIIERFKGERGLLLN
jgi:predicted dienelactone hydrolase